MSRYKSTQTAYNPQKKKNVSIWRLDTNIVTVTHFNVDAFTEESKTYHTDYIRYHLHYSDNKYPDRLRRLVNESKIIEYLDDLELKVGEAIARQVERWKKFDSCYQKAVLNGDAEKMLGLENCFIGMAREVIFEFGRLCFRVQPFIILFLEWNDRMFQPSLLHDPLSYSYPNLDVL